MDCLISHRKKEPSERGRREESKGMETEGARMSDKESERSVLEPFSSAEALNCLRRPHWPSVLHTHTRTHTVRHSPISG